MGLLFPIQTQTYGGRSSCRILPRRANAERSRRRSLYTLLQKPPIPPSEVNVLPQRSASGWSRVLHSPSCQAPISDKNSSSRATCENSRAINSSALLIRATSHIVPMASKFFSSMSTSASSPDSMLFRAVSFVLAYPANLK